MKILISAVALFFGLTMVGVEAEAAKRLGGGKSMGAQRSMTQQQATPKAPAQQQQAGAPAQQPAAAPAQTGNKWLGPLAGLAMGAGLMALFMNNGISGALSGLLLAGAIAAVAMLAFRAWRSRAAQAPMQYAGHQNAAAPEPIAMGGGSAAPHAVAATAGRWPADFNETEFIRHARLNFVHLQERMTPPTARRWPTSSRPICLLKSRHSGKAKARRKAKPTSSRWSPKCWKWSAKACCMWPACGSPA